MCQMYLQTVERLGQLGFAQYEISNFARPGYESRHNLKYWLLGRTWGWGPAPTPCGTVGAFTLTGTGSGRTKAPAATERSKFS